LSSLSGAFEDVDPVALEALLDALLDVLLVRQVREPIGVLLDVLDRGVPIRSLVARGDPLVKAVAEVEVAGVLATALLAEPVDQIRLVFGTE